MRVAITSTNNNVEAKIDPRFGRCSYFVIYDSDLDSIEYIPNPNKEVSEGAGPASVELIASKKVDKVVSGGFGNKIKPLLESLKIQMIIINEPEKQVNDIIKKFNTKNSL